MAKNKCKKNKQTKKTLTHKNCNKMSYNITLLSLEMCPHGSYLRVLDLERSLNLKLTINLYYIFTMKTIHCYFTWITFISVNGLYLNTWKNLKPYLFQVSFLYLFEVSFAILFICSYSITDFYFLLIKAPCSVCKL